MSVLRVKLMPDYGCFPLWWIDHPEGRTAIEEGDLPLRAETIERLWRWAEEYSRQLDWNNPPEANPDFTPEDLKRFDEEGRALLVEIRRDLGPDYEVLHYEDLSTR